MIDHLFIRRESSKSDIKVSLHLYTVCIQSYVHSLIRTDKVGTDPPRNIIEIWPITSRAAARGDKGDFPTLSYRNRALLNLKSHAENVLLHFFKVVRYPIFDIKVWRIFNGWFSRKFAVSRQ